MSGGCSQLVLASWRMGLLISNNTYVRAIRWAHKMHHKHINKDHSESFGFLLVNKKYWDKVRRDKKLMAGSRKVEYAPEAD